MKNRTVRAPLATLPMAILATFPIVSLAQTATAPMLEETVVTATRNTQLLTSALPHTTVISREDIERSQAFDLVTLLQREAGLQRTQSGGVGTVSTLFMRGAPSLQTLVLIDGVPQNRQDASGAVGLEHVMLDNVERVEIVRGNVSAIYGSGAIGGVIQVFTRTGTREPAAKLSLELGPRATAKLAAQVSTSVGSTSLSAGASRYVTNGFSSINSVQQTTANPDKDAYDNTSVNLSLTHRLASTHQVGVRVSNTKGESDYDNAFGAATDVQHASTRLNQVSVFSDNTWGNWRSRVSLSEQLDKSRTTDDGTYGSTDTYRTRVRTLNWVNTIGLGGDWLGTAGLEKQWQSVDTTTSSASGTPYAVERQATALFGGMEGKLGAGDLQVNVRHDKVGALSKATGFVGYGYPLNAQIKLIGSLSTAFNAPPLGYLYGPGYGNASLKPEQARSHELGAQWESGKQLLRATYFDTRVKDQLEYDRTTSRFANIGRASNSGVEFSYQGRVSETDMRSSLTLQDPKNDLTGASLQRRARTMFSMGVSQPIGALRLDADLRYSGKRPDRYTDVATFTTVETTLASYAVLDLAASYRLSPAVELKARLDNVTDREYQTVYGYNQQPRSLYVGLSWKPRF